MKKLAFTWDRGVGAFLVLTIIVGSFVTPYFAVSSNISFVIQDIGEIAIIVAIQNGASAFGSSFGSSL